MPLMLEGDVTCFVLSWGNCSSLLVSQSVQSKHTLGIALKCRTGDVDQ